MRLDATNPKAPTWRKYLFPCDCVESHYLELHWWEDADVDYPGYLEVNETSYGDTIWTRIKEAFKVLRGQRKYFGGIVLDLETTDELIEAINEQREAVIAKKNGKEDDTVQPAN